MCSHAAPGLDSYEEEPWPKLCSEHEELRRRWFRGKIDDRCIRRLNDWCLGPRSFRISDEIHEKVYARRADQFGNLDDCTSDNFLDTLKSLIEAQEVYESILMRKYDLTGERLTTRRGQVCYSLTNLNFNFGRKCWKYDFVVLKDESSQFSIIVQVMKNRDNIIELKTPPSFPQWLMQVPLNIQIVPCGQLAKSQHKAIARFKIHAELRKMIFEDLGEPNDEVKIDVAQTSTPELEERLECLDENQRRAVVGILEAKCRPKPYILFGPPGTGKTRTLIEAVVQIYKRSTGQQRRANEQAVEPDILVCAYGNNSTNEIYNRLSKELPRLRSKCLEPNSFQSSTGSCRVTTMHLTGCLLGVRNFDYVLIDGAGERSTPELLVPACLLKPGGCLVLCDDFHQLGRTNVGLIWETKMGDWRWFLQRLAKFNIYQRDPTTASYNGNYVTVLSDCYRCDERILAPCHRKFGYNNLHYVNKTPDDLLQRLGLSKPIQLKDVKGDEHHLERSTMPHNLAEAKACVDLVVRFIESGVRLEQVGVMSLYRFQVHAIIRLLEQRYGRQQDCKIDTVGASQGCERDIVILSTYHTETWEEDGSESRADRDPTSLALLRSTMNFVALSRARWLFVAVGSREFLESSWPELLQDAGSEL